MKASYAPANVQWRPVVLVGHDIQQDINYIKILGLNLCDNDHLLEIVDTKNIHQHIGRLMNGAALGKILRELNIPHTHLHNAGNDAVYTLQALLGLVVKKRKSSQLASVNVSSQAREPCSTSTKTRESRTEYVVFLAGVAGDAQTKYDRQVPIVRS
jgi:DNA polymerase III alpha subunit (gram-positive type)